MKKKANFGAFNPSPDQLREKHPVIVVHPNGIPGLEYLLDLGCQQLISPYVFIKELLLVNDKGGEILKQRPYDGIAETVVESFLRLRR